MGEIMSDTVHTAVEARFVGLCPNCDGEIAAGRLAVGLPCDNCLPSPSPDPCAALAKRGILAAYGRVCRLLAEVTRFREFFARAVSSPPWSLQLSWAKRVLLGRSFAILAPTGVGKTTFGLAMAAYLPARSYIIVPTRLLVEELLRRLAAFAPGKRIVGFTGKRRERELIASGEFDVLITTSAFLQRNCELLLKAFSSQDDPGGPGIFIFVDDVDSLLKASKNVDRVLSLLGFSQDEIEAAMSGEEVEKGPRGVLVVSSATAQPRTKRVQLFQRLLGFEVQRPTTVLRNVVDLEARVGSPRDAVGRAVELVKRFGPGAFVYVSQELGREGVERVIEALDSAGIPPVSYEDFTEEAQDDFRERRIWAAVGISRGGNPLVRGVDLPEAVRYAVFVGVPVILFPAEVDSLAPGRLMGLLLALRPVIPSEEAESDLEYLRRYLTLKEEDLHRYPRIRERLEAIARVLREVLRDKGKLAKLHRSGNVSLLEREGRTFIAVADAASYLQASGRTSRLSPWGLTRGLSVLLWWDEAAFRGLRRRLSVLTAQEIEFQPLASADINALLQEIDHDRERLRELRRGAPPKGVRELLRTSLFIVESPNKARTIAAFFGRPQRRSLGEVTVYEVTTGDRLLLIAATMGHLTDLVEEGGIHGVLELDGRFVPVYGPIRTCRRCNEQTTLPRCPRCGGEPDVDKLQTVRSLRELALEVDEVLVGTDPDAEGEKIAWDLYLALRPFNPAIRRVEFHEVTPRAIRAALASPREVAAPLVSAQIVRRVADRWVGFSLSQHLQARFGSRSLSAGRVQTPVLGWVIAREEERRRRKGLIVAALGGAEVRFEFDDPAEAREVFTRIREMRVERVREAEEKVAPPPPFSTSTLLIEASRGLRLPPGRTMALAQALFEAGLITYHRTDSTRVSDAGLSLARRYIAEAFGEGYVRARRFGEGGAHECIRPTRPLPPEELRELLATGRVEFADSRGAVRLYELIWRRFLASQMRETRVRKVTLRFSLDAFSQEVEFIVAVVEPGFDLVSPLPVVELPAEPALEPRACREIPAAPPLTQGELVALMRERGLGRPSTYARIVETLLERRYVVERRGFLFPTRLGKEVHSYLAKRFPCWTGEEFTRELEAHMDAVEAGRIDYQQVLREIRSVVEESGRA
ncbi:reverse gyrase [Candidatus Bipolaricaulota sp. J31]